MGSGAFSDLQFQAGSGEQEVSSTGKIRDKWKGFILVIAEKKILPVEDYPLQYVVYTS